MLDDPGTVELVMNVFILALHAELQPELALNEAELQRFNEDTRELFRELEKRKLYWLARDDLPFPERRRRYLDDLGQGFSGGAHGADGDPVAGGCSIVG